MPEEKDISVITPRETLLLTETAKIVCALAQTGTVSDVTATIKSVYGVLAGLGRTEDVEAKVLTPAVPIKRSVFPDYIICLEDGRKLKMLKRHLQSSYGLTPEQYRERWGLPADYPMTAPNYALRRSDLARAIGLGRIIKEAPASEAPAPEVPAKRKGRAAA